MEDGGAAGEVGDGAGDLAAAVVGAGAEGEAEQGALQPLFAGAT